MDSQTTSQTDPYNGVHPSDILATLPLNHQAYGVLRESDFTTCEASKALGITRQQGHNIQKKLDRYMITGNAKLLRDAKKAVSLLVKGLPVGQVEKVKDSTVLSAAQTILDRSDPIIHKSQVLSANIQLSSDQVRMFEERISRKDGSK
jgi:hypothetical protein